MNKHEIEQLVKTEDKLVQIQVEIGKINPDLEKRLINMRA